MDIELVAPLRTHSPVVWGDDAATSVVDGFAVLVQPFTDSLKAVEGKGGEIAPRFRADVEQEVGILSGSTNEHLYQLLRRFVVAVGNRIAPVVVDGLARLERQTADALS